MNSHTNSLFINIPNWRDYAIAMATIVYEVVDGAGDALQCSTFVSGKTTDEAIAAWAAKHRKTKIVATAVVTAGRHKPVSPTHVPAGELIEVEDTLLAQMAAGLVSGPRKIA